MMFNRSSQLPVHVLCSYFETNLMAFPLKAQFKAAALMHPLHCIPTSTFSSPLLTNLQARASYFLTLVLNFLLM